mgnify:CR=1 FL=1
MSTFVSFVISSLCSDCYNDDKANGLRLLSALPALTDAIWSELQKLLLATEAATTAGDER